MAGRRRPARRLDPDASKAGEASPTVVMAASCGAPTGSTPEEARSEAAGSSRRRLSGAGRWASSSSKQRVNAGGGLLVFSAHRDEREDAEAGHDDRELGARRSDGNGRRSSPRMKGSACFRAGSGQRGFDGAPARVDQGDGDL